jgi:hypothetical protein
MVEGFGGAGSTLHLFAQGAWDFLVGASALSAIIALISTALEEFYRPRAQRRLVSEWLRVQRFYESPFEGDIQPLSSWWKEHAPDVLERSRSAYFSLPPDQLCAQVVRLLQSDVEQFDGTRGQAAGEPFRDRWSRWSERIEGAVDELQSTLVRQTAVRSYTMSAATAAVIGMLLFAVAIPDLNLHLPAPGVLRWMILTAVFVAVATLLGPIMQALISRFLWAR